MSERPPHLRVVNGNGETPEPVPATNGQQEHVEIPPDSLLARRMRCDQSFNALLQIRIRRTQLQESIIARDSKAIMLEQAQLGAMEQAAIRDAVLSLLEMSQANCQILLALAERAGLVK